MSFKSVLVLFAITLTTSAFAQNAGCESQAADKKLAGAAKTSFVKKCEKDAATACEAMSKDKKLAGAAKNSFEKKCIKDAKG